VIERAWMNVSMMTMMGVVQALLKVLIWVELLSERGRSQNEG